MPINKIEVVGHNPGQAIAVGVPIGEKLTIDQGDIVRVHVSFDHRGPAKDLTLLCCIGHITATIFIEDACASIPIHLDESMDYIPYEASVDIDTSPISGGTGYDLEAEITQYTRATHIEVPDVIDVTGEEYELIQHTIYPWAFYYEGPCEVATTTFSLPVGPPPIVDWIGGKIANAFVDRVAEEGSRVLELKVSRYTAVPWVNYKLEVTAAVTSEGIAIWPVLAALPWRLIITSAIIAAIAIAVARLAILPILRGSYAPPAFSPKIKEKWTKETTISSIIDIRPGYSREDLEAMSTEDVKELWDEIYEEEAPPAKGWPWYVWLGIAGVAIAGSTVAVTVIPRILPKKK